LAKPTNFVQKKADMFQVGFFDDEWRFYIWLSY